MLNDSRRVIYRFSVFKRLSAILIAKDATENKNIYIFL